MTYGACTPGGGIYNQIASWVISMLGADGDGASWNEDNGGGGYIGNTPYNGDPGSSGNNYYIPPSNSNGSTGGGGSGSGTPPIPPYGGGAIWVTKWVPDGSGGGCIITPTEAGPGNDPNGGGPPVDPNGCPTGPGGHWESYQIDPQDALDTYTGDEEDEPDDDNGNGITGPTAHIPSQITLNNGSIVNVVFGSTSDGSADQPVNVKVIATLKQALNIASTHVTINTIYIKATTNGGHSTTKSNHFRALAVDISRINGVPIIVQGASDIVKNLQLALDQSTNIRENFGPFFLHKLGVDHNSAPAHRDHIHFSVNQ